MGPTARFGKQTKSKFELTAGFELRIKSRLGWHIDSEHALDIIWHNGGSGGSRSYVAFLIEPQVGVVVLSNSNSEVDELGRKILYLLALH